MGIRERFKLFRILWQEASALEREGVFKTAAEYPAIVDKTGKISERVKPPIVEGDGKAEYLPDMTDEEMEDYLHNEVQGWDKFTDRLKKRLGGK